MKYVKFLLILSGIGGSISFSRSQSAVTLKEEPLTLPTYEVAPADPNPYFYTGRTYQGAQGHIYPYPMYDVLTDRRHDKTYRSVRLENQYTRICVMPELGGRILWAQDKATGYDFFYRQHVVKPALIGMIGAWMSGGVEWNIPHHHRASSQLPVDYTLTTDADGSKTVWVGETELRHRLRWTVGLTLRPDKSYIEATIKIFNPTPFIQSFLYWANVSVHCNENYQVIFPPATRFGTQHAKSEFTDWPVGQGRYGGMDRTGTDLSYWRNHPSPASIFAWNYRDDFLGGYDYGKDAGTIHVGNHHIVTGKKFFLWGNNKEAEMWNRMLTETDGDYLELMVGAFSDNQPDYSWIAPGETKIVKQYWYPAIKLGGIKAASKEGAVNVERISPDTLRIAFNTTSPVKNAKITVTAGDRPMYEKTIDIDPVHPFAADLRLNEPGIRDEDIRTALSRADGTEIVSYRPTNTEEEKMPAPVTPPGNPADYRTVEELYQAGLRIEQFHNATLDPMDYYREALTRDSLDSRIHTVIGIRLVKEGQYAEAGKHLKKAVNRVTENYTSPKDAESLYYLGIALLQQGHRKEAADWLWKAAWRKEFQTAAYFALTRIACLEKDYAGALELIDRCIATNTDHTEAKAVKSYILRKLGRPAEATALLTEAKTADPLAFWLLTETEFLKGNGLSGRAFENLQTHMGDPLQTTLELAVNYGQLGAYPEAIALLEAHAGTQSVPSPLIHYYRGYYKQKNGAPDAAVCFAQAAGKPGKYCFPFRPEEIDILGKALETNPTDAYGHLYLGNLYYFLNQQEKAVQQWQEAVRLQPACAGAWRNLGFASMRRNDPVTAAGYYEKAIRADSSDPLYFYELDLLYDDLRKPASQRLAWLEKYGKTVEKRDDATSRKVKLYIETGQYEKALRILRNRHFHVWEGGGDIHSVFVDACLLNGLREMRKHRYIKALENFEAGATYPDNLEVGEPDHGGRNPEACYLAGLAWEASGDPAQAKSCYARAVAYPERRCSPLHYYRAMAFRKLGNPTEASRLLNDLEQYAQSRLDKTGKIDFFSKFGGQADSNKQRADLHYLLGLAALGKGETVRARNEFQEALQKDPGHSWATYYARPNP